MIFWDGVTSKKKKNVIGFSARIEIERKKGREGGVEMHTKTGAKSK